MKRTLLVILFLSVVFIGSPKAYSSELNINFHPQNTLVWCWAATIAMVVEYVTGNSIEDCEILNIYDSSRGGPGTCCRGDYRCIRTGQPNEMGHILGDLFGIHGRYISRPPSFDEIKLSIDNKHPLIATLQTSGSGHVVVISGYELPDQVIVLDPMNGKHIVNYQTIISNFRYGNWVGSFLITPENSNVRNDTAIPKQPISTPASQCITNLGSCFMSISIPIGTSCFCPSQMGNIQGIAQ